MTQKTPVQSKERSEKVTTKVRAVPLSEQRLFELRLKHLSSGQGALSVAESKEMMFLGNTSHQSNLRSSPASPRQRAERIAEGQADYLVIACSDARIPTLDSEADGLDLVGVQIRVAGNVIPSEGVSLEEIKEAAARVKEGGLILIEGHVHCGAVKEHVKWKEAGMGDTGSEPLNTLLHAVFGDTPQENAMAQLGKLRSIVGDDKNIAAVVYDWDAGQVDIVSPEPSDLVMVLKSKWDIAHKAENTDGKLGERLSQTQKPHAIVVASNDMPFSIDTVFDSKQNEIFSTTGSEGGLDHFDEASVLYAAEHLGTKHIAFVAHGDAETVERMFDKWESDLRSMGQLAEKLDSGDIVITRMAYDLENGAVQTLQEAA